MQPWRGNRILKIATYQLMLVVICVVLSACYVRASTPVTPEVAETCPNLSGAYFFPGGTAAHKICSVLDEPSHSQGGAFRWPHPTGGFAEMRSPAILVIQQQACASLEFRILHLVGGQPFARTSTRDLVRRRKRMEVTWGADSLTYRDRIKPQPSFTIAPVNVAREEIFLRLDPSGALTYHAGYWELTEKHRVLTDCTLPPATPADWRSVGVEALMDEYVQTGVE